VTAALGIVPPTERGRVSRIVVGVDGSDAAAAALRWALRRAARTGGSVAAMAGLQTPLMTGYLEATVAYDPTVLHDATAATLKAALADAVAATGVDVPTSWEVVEGGPARVLLDAGRDAALLVVGSRGRGAFAGALLGSVSQQVAHHTPCPLVIVPERALGRADAPIRTIVVGVDDSPGARAALHWAAAEAQALGAHLRAVTSWQDPSYVAAPVGAVAAPPLDLSGRAAAVLGTVVAEVRAGGGPEVEEVVLQGPAGPSLLAEGEHADLLVVGSRGAGGFVGLLLGSVSQQVAAHAPCPVAVIPEPPAR
jgi:nucleotide-binding universal stress UspA family protein